MAWDEVLADLAAHKRLSAALTQDLQGVLDENLRLAQEKQQLQREVQEYRQAELHAILAVARSHGFTPQKGGIA